MKGAFTGLFLFLTALTSIGYTKSARQKPKTQRIAIVPFPIQDGKAQLAAKNLTTAAAMNPLLNVVDIYMLLVDRDTPALMALSRAQDNFNAGIKAFTSGSYKKAVQFLQKAVELYLPNYGAANMSKDVTDSFLYLGSALAASDRVKDAQKAFLMALTLDPAADIYSVTSNPDATELFQSVRQKRDGLPTGSISVASSPTGALVYVDGAFKGSAPIDVKNLKAGKHVVTLSMVGFLRKTVLIDLKAGEMKRLPIVTLTSPTKAILLERIISRLLNNDSQAYIDAKSLLPTDYLVVTRSLADGQHNTMFDLNRRVAFSNKHAIRNLQTAKATLDNLITLANKKITFVTAVSTKGKKKQGSIIKKWWFWTAIGVAVVGGTTAAILLTRHSGSTGMTKNGTGAIILQF